MVGAEYLKKVQRAVRLMNPSEDIKAELAELIEECRADLVLLGVDDKKANDEEDVTILGAVRSFVRWKMFQDEKEALANMSDYFLQRDEIRKRGKYKKGGD